VGDAMRLPVGACGRASHSWWAMVILLCVDASIFASLAFAHLHVAMALDVCPPSGARLPDGGWVLASCALLVLGSGAMLWAQQRIEAQSRLRFAVMLAMSFTGASFVLSWVAYVQAGLSPRAQAWSATVATLQGWQGFHVAVLMVMGGYVLARSWSGRLAPEARATLDNTALLWHYVIVQGIVTAALVQGLPRLLG
jgi:cytochrome c oxidase subunit I+III